MKSRLGTIIIGLIICCNQNFVYSVSAAEFEVDANTLFLAHFNDKIDADFAKGTAVHTQGNASITKDKQGKYGEALVCAKGLVTNPQGISAPYRQLAFPCEGNLDLKKGTIEFWLNCNFPKKDIQSIYDLFDLSTSHLLDKNGNIKRVSLVVREYRPADGPAEKYFHSFFLGEDKEVKDITCKIDWRPGEWHHVAATWDNEEATLFLDGVKKGSCPISKGLFGADTSVLKGDFLIGGLWNNDETHATEGLIDELRISNTVRYLEDFKP